MSQELQVDGDLLLNITEQDLIHDLGMKSGLTRKRLVLITLEYLCLTLCFVITSGYHCSGF